MKIISIFILSLFLFAFTSAWAQLDMGTETLIRTFPVAGYVKATAGYGLKFWDKSDKAPFLYGFARPMASARTSGVINATDGRIEIYPVSIFGLFVGNETVYRKNKALDTFDCSVIDCQGTISKNYFGARTALKFKQNFFMAEARFLNLKSNHQNRFFTDELSTLIAGPGADKLTTFISILGHEITDIYASAIVRMENFTKNTDQHSSMTLFMGQFKFQNNAVLVGPGLFHMRTDSDVFTLVTLWTWRPEKGLLLF